MSLPYPVLAYTLTVDLAAVLVVASSVRFAPVTPSSWLWFGLLAVGCLLHLEAARGIERVREIAAGGSPYATMQSTWYFAGILLLPPPLLAALIAIGFAYEWFVMFRGRAVAFRKVFSAGTVVLGSAAAHAVFAAFSFGPAPYIAMLNSPHGLLTLVGAGFAYWLVNYALVVGVIATTGRVKSMRSALGKVSNQLVIAGSVGLGSAVALVFGHVPWMAPVMLVSVLAIQLGLLPPHLRAASLTDSKTGLVDSTWWQAVAERELDRARRLSSTVAVLMLDLDHFKRVNDRYGHLTGDRVLRAVADAIRHRVRDRDLVGRWGGEEFVVLMPGLPPEETWVVAERIRAHIPTVDVTTQDRDGTEVHITGLTVSIGAGRYPDDATELGSLLLVADDALLRAKEQGRDRVVTASPRPRQSD